MLQPDVRFARNDGVAVMWGPIVIKVSGHELDTAPFLCELAAIIADMRSPVILVHGGGREISQLQAQSGIEPRMVDGVRITDAASLSVVTMVLCGLINKRLVRHLVAAGVDALGMSGIDRGLIRARKMQHAEHDMGFTGEVVTVADAPLRAFLDQGITPVIAPVCMGDDSALNVNADQVAGAVATAVGANRIVFVTNAEGVLRDGVVLPMLTPTQTEDLIRQQVITDGMIPKVRTALQCIQSGVPGAVITNLSGLRSHGGTTFLFEETSQEGPQP